MEYQDKTLRCRAFDCGGDFTWTAGEQQFYAQKNLVPPRRCPDCRARAKAQRAAQENWQAPWER